MTKDPKTSSKKEQNKIITELTAHQVFVYSSNQSGFSGAGSAGMAMRGTSNNNWRDDETFLQAMRAPAGSPQRKGKWCTFGHVQGPTEGHEGKAYAIQTIKNPGARRSFPLSGQESWTPKAEWETKEGFRALRDIQSQLIRLADYARRRPDQEFLISKIGQGYAGYSAKEIEELWKNIHISPNLIFL